MESKQLIIIGGRGKGGAIAGCVNHNRDHYQDYEYEVMGFLNDSEMGTICGYPVLGKTMDCNKFLDDDNIYFVFAIHMIGRNKVADQLFRELKIPLDRLATIIHKSVIILDGAVLDPGVVVLAQSYISFAHLKFGTMVMVGSMVSHDAIVGPLAYLSTGCVIGSCVKIGRSSSIGMSANVIEENNVGDFAVIAAGAVVNCDVPENTIYGGVPANFIKMIKD